MPKNPTLDSVSESLEDHSPVATHTVAPFSHARFNNLTHRVNPFPAWVSDYLDVDESTFMEVVSDDRLYNPACSLVLRHVGRSFRGRKKNLPTKSSSTILMEELARARLRKKNEMISDAKEEDRDESRCDLTLGLGLHEFAYDGHRMWALHQTIGSPMMSRCGATIFTSLVIFVAGRGKRAVLEAFCELATKPVPVAKSQKLFFNIYRFNAEYGRWLSAGKRLTRELDTIVLPSATKERVLADMERFLSRSSLRWYFEHGIPYKRSYLFHGVPGSGKSSLIQALAGHFERNLCFLQPMDPRMTDDVFKSCIESAPSPCMIVLEDVDALFGKDRSKKHQSCPLTFSGLLNGIDGVGGLDGQIFIMSTNFVDRLDDALVRSGRVDLYVEFPLACDEQITRMFELFCPGDEVLSGEFLAEARRAFPKGVSMAALQQHFIQHMQEPGSVIIETLPMLGERLDVVAEFDKRLVATDHKETEEETEEVKPAVEAEK